MIGVVAVATTLMPAQQISVQGANARLGNPAQVGSSEFVRHQHNDVWVTAEGDNYLVWREAQNQASGPGQVGAELDFDRRIARSGLFTKVACGTLVRRFNQRAWVSADAQAMASYVEILQGPLKGRRVWTPDVRSLTPSIGETVFLVSSSGDRSVSLATSSAGISRTVRGAAYPVGTEVELLAARSVGSQTAYKVRLRWVPGFRTQPHKTGWISSREFTYAHPQWLVRWNASGKHR
jgi:hypothetical protein